MGLRGPDFNPRLGYVVAMARRGDLASLDEGAIIAGVTKATVRRWLIDAHIDWRLTRRQWLAKRHLRCEDWANGRPPPRKPTKEEQHARASRAKAQWDAKKELERLAQARGRDPGQ